MPLPPPESLGLPSRPGGPSTATRFASSPLSTSTLPAPGSGAGPSSSLPSAPSTTSAADPTTCAHCSTPPRYTCPRCAARTCSLPCARAHKATTGCTGVRDPAAFVPLNKLSQATWDGDYAWLEERRRQISQWGEGVTPDEAARVGLVPGGANQSRGGRNGGPGAAGQAPLGRAKKSKLDGLRWAIGEIGAEVDILPDGMARRRTNQSSWNPKTRSLNLTVQLQLHVPLPATGDTHGEGTGDDHTDADAAPLVSHPRVLVLPRPATPTTLASLLPPPQRDTPVAELAFAVAYHLPRWRERQRDRAAARAPGGAGEAAVAGAAPPGGGKRFFPLLDASAPLDEAFRGTAWIEFPTVHVWPRAAWDAQCARGEVVVVPLLVPVEGRRKAGDGDGKRVGAAEGGAEGDGASPKRPRLAASGGTVDGPVAMASGTGAPAAAGPAAAGPAAAGQAAAGLALGALGDYASDDDADADDPESGDIELSPEMAAALGQALVADFGEAAVGQ